MVERCPKCGQTVIKDSKEDAYWCDHCDQYFSYQEVKKSSNSED